MPFDVAARLRLCNKMRVQGSRPTVIVADDDRLLRESMRMSLRASFDILLAADGKEALDLFMRQGASALVLDGSMPQLSGYEVCERVRALPQGRNIPICIVTSADDVESIERAFAAGANDFYLKPVHLSILARKLLVMMTQERDNSGGPQGPEDVVFDALPLPAALVDSSGRILRINRAFARQFRSSPQPNDSWYTFFSPGTGMNDGGRVGSFQALFEGRSLNLTLTALPPGAGANRLLLAIETPNPPQPPKATPNPPPAARILVMEDQELVKRSIVRLLAREEHRLTVVENADAALSTFHAAQTEGDRFSLVLLDLSIPGSQGGAEVLGAIREIDPGVRAIATSGSWEDPVMNRPKDFGFDGALPKPFSRDELLNTISQVLST